eukprot:s2399_g3.t1
MPTGDQRGTHKDGPKEGPWGSLWPEWTLEAAASSAQTLTSSVAVAFAGAADANEVPQNLRSLCDLAGECAAWLHARTMIAIAQVLLQTPFDFKNLLRLLLRSLAKDAQPCHSSDWVSLASELQLIGLAHGDGALDQRCAEAAAMVRTRAKRGEMAAAVELFWVFLTAKALNEELLTSLESLQDVPDKAPDVLAALLCGLAQPCVHKILGAQRLLELSEHFAKHLREVPTRQLPTRSLPRVALALADLLQLTKGGLGLRQALLSVNREATSRLDWLSMEDLADLVVSLSWAPAEQQDLMDPFLTEAGRRLQGHAGPPIPSPGSAVVLRRALGSVPCGSIGLLGEFCLVTGRWRVWLEGDSVDAREEDFGLLDGGARPQRCCFTCWRLAPRLWKSAEDASREFCDECRQNCGRAEEVPKDPCLRGMEDLPAGLGPSPRALARMSLAAAHARRPLEGLLKQFRAAAEQLYHKVTDELPFQEETGLSKPSSLVKSGRDIPVFVVNLDRSPHRLEEMRREVQRCGVLCARRFAATDGRHRVVRRSQCEPYTRDLTSFALRWDEARPAIGVALTADQERHYVGYAGSWLSHMRALRQGFEEGSPFVVVLEDDQVLSPHFNGVLRDILDSAGDLLDVVILGPLDWRLRSLQYAQRRKVMQLRHPTSTSRSSEEECMAELYGYKPSLCQESTYFLYSIGSRAMTGEDLLSTGCCGVWGYLVSRRGCQKMEASMKFMWESFDDVLQAELQGDNRFTSFVGKHRLWAVWPPLVSSDGKWPSQNSGEDLELGRQLAPVSPHASFRDHSLQVQAARLLLGPQSGASKDQRHLPVAATSALLWPPVEPVWAYVVRGWRRLFAQRAGSGGGFELRTEMQHKLYKERRFFELASEGLTWSWTVLRAAFLFGFARPLPALWSTAPPEGPPVQLPPLSLRVVFGPWSQLNWAPSAWWRDLLDAAPGSRIHQLQAAAFVPFTGAELRQQLPRAAFRDIKVESMDTAESAGSGEALVLAAEVAVTLDLLQALRKELAAGHPVLATARSLATLAELWNSLSEGALHLRVAFVGANPFASQLRPPAAVGAAPVPGRWARICGLTKRSDLNGSEALLAEERNDGRWRVSTSSGDLAVREENLEVFVEEPWPPTPSPGLTVAEWKAICDAPSLSTAATGGTNAFWLGIQPCGQSQKMCPFTAQGE